MALMALVVVIGVGIALDKQFGLDEYPGANQDKTSQTSSDFSESEQDTDTQNKDAKAPESADAMSAAAREQLIVFGNTQALPSYQELVSSPKLYQGALFELTVEVTSVIEPQTAKDRIVYARYTTGSNDEIMLCIGRQMYVEKAQGIMTTFCSFEGLDNGEPLFKVRSYSCE